LDHVSSEWQKSFQLIARLGRAKIVNEQKKSEKIEPLGETLLYAKKKSARARGLFQAKKEKNS